MSGSLLNILNQIFFFSKLFLRWGVHAFHFSIWKWRDFLAIGSSFSNRIHHRIRDLSSSHVACCVTVWTAGHLCNSHLVTNILMRSWGEMFAFFFLWLNNLLSFAGRAQSVMWRTLPTLLRCYPSHDFNHKVRVWVCDGALIFLAAGFQQILLKFEMCIAAASWAIVPWDEQHQTVSLLFTFRNVRERESELQSNTSLLTENYPRATCTSYWLHGFSLDLTVWFRIKYLAKDFRKVEPLCGSLLQAWHYKICKK